MKPIIHNGRIAIIGAGDLGKQIAHLAMLNSEQVVGFFDDVVTAQYCNVCGKTIPILGKLADIERKNEIDRYYDTMLIGIGYKHFQARQNIFERLQQAGIKFATLIDESCWIDPTAAIGEGSVLFPMCHIGQESIVENNVLLNPAVYIAHNDTIGAHSFFGGNANVAGFSTIGRRNFIGVGTTIIDNITVCDDVLIGAGAVVTKTITTSGTYVGNPAHKLHK